MSLVFFISSASVHARLTLSLFSPLLVHTHTCSYSALLWESKPSVCHIWNIIFLFLIFQINFSVSVLIAVKYFTVIASALVLTVGSLSGQA